MMKIYTRGFTLIELMIVLLIAGLLLLVAAPFTSQWSNSTKITEAMGVINQAVSRAKASALSNPNGIARVKVTGGTSVTQVAAAVCFLSGTVQVRVAADAATPAVCDSGSRAGTKIWLHKLPVGVTIKNADDSNLNKGLCFDNRGLIVGTCASDGNLKITVGATNETVQYY
jgi:prepilin-type N-terminal cleavage/methylation domain-containing protein